MSAIQIQGLTRDYGKGKGIFDLTFQVAQGEVFGFLGPNGAGKTTTIRHLMGFLRPEHGSCQIGGLDCWKKRHKIQRNLGYLPGEIQFFEDMTGREFLDFLSAYRKIPQGPRFWEMLDRFEVDPRGKIKKMSKGMKQKLGLVAAFMHDPEILILDEPTSGLDPLMQSRFLDLMAEEKKKGKTVLLSSHIFEEVDRTCDRIGMIRAGKLVAVDSVQALRQQHTHTYRVQLDSPQQARQFAEDFHGELEGSSVTLRAQQSMESIFMNYYGGDAP